MSHSTETLKYCEWYGSNKTSLALNPEDKNSNDVNERHLKGHHNRLSY